MSELKPKDERGRYKARHGMYGTKLYHIWNGMCGRCLNPNNKDYNDYGGRGITICEEWRIPENFFGWAFLNGYNVDLSLDRKDTNKGYSPDNCRWISLAEQQRNKRNNRFIEYKGEIHCIAEWSEITGISKDTIASRLRYGWTPEEIFTIPPSYRNSRYRKATKEWNKRADTPHKCGDCDDFDKCKEYVDADETFPEVGGCKAFRAKMGEAK